MKLVATFDNVILRVRPRVSVTRGGLALPDKAREEDDFCEVVDIRPAATLGMDCPILVGDLVLRPVGISEWHNEETDETFLVCKVTDIVAVGVEDGEVAGGDLNTGYQVGHP
jgi:co-chaperonin GroES (HSP10)